MAKESTRAARAERATDAEAVSATRPFSKDDVDALEAHLEGVRENLQLAAAMFVFVDGASETVAAINERHCRAQFNAAAACILGAVECMEPLVKRLRASVSAESAECSRG
jgi:hypothetical protein